MKRTQLVQNVFFILMLNLLIKAVWIFGIDRNVQISVGYQAYGMYQALFNLALIFQIILDFGISQYSSREVAIDNQSLQHNFGTMLVARMFLFVVYMLFVFIVAKLLGYSGYSLRLLIWVLLIMVLNATLVFFRAQVAALHFFKTDGVLSIIDRLFMIIICGALLIVSQWNQYLTIETFVKAQVFSLGIAVGIAFITFAKLSPYKLTLEWNFNRLIHILKSSSPYALLVFLMAIYMRADVVMIERIGGGVNGASQAGVYIAAFRLLDVANIFGLMFAGVLMPLFSKMLAQKKNIAPIVRTAVDVMMPIAFVCALTAVFYAKDIMLLLYHRASVTNDALLLAILMCSFPAYCLMYIYSTLLTAGGKIKLLNLISLGIVILNLSLHYVLIQLFQAQGAAVTVLITEWLVAAVVIYYAHLNYKMPHNYPWILKHLLFVACMFMGFFCLKQIQFYWLYEIVLLAVVAVLLLFILKIWSPKQILALFKKDSQ